MSIFKNEPIACIGLVVTLLLGVLSSPILVEWYSSPKVSAVVEYKSSNDGRCIPQNIKISNVGKAPATNIRVQYSTDYFSSRGDIVGYYSGDEPTLKIQKNVEYTEGNNHLLIPSLLPGLSQEFIFIEEFKVAGMQDTRLALLAKKDPSVLNYPKLELVTSSEGQIGVTIGANGCE